MELFAKIVNDLQPLTIFAKISILDISLGTKYSSDVFTTQHKAKNLFLQNG